MAIGKRIIRSQQKRLVFLYAKLKKLRVKLSFKTRRKFKVLMKVSGFKKTTCCVVLKKRRNGVLNLIVKGYTNGSKKALSSIVALSSKMKYYSSLKNKQQRPYSNYRR